MSRPHWTIVVTTRGLTEGNLTTREATGLEILTGGGEIGPIEAVDADGTRWHVPKAQVLSSQPGHATAKTKGAFWKVGEAPGG